MKKFIRYMSAAVLLIGIAACSEGINAPETPAIEEGVTLTIMSSAPQTRTMAGVQDLNENKIVSLHYFLYPENPSDPTADNTEVDPKHWGKITGLNAQNLQMIRLNLTEYELNYEVFPRPYTSCDVYVIANLPESIDVETLADRKLSTLKQLALEADFASSLTQENFVMEGMAQATIIDRKNIIAATGTIPVDRVASKVSVNVRVVESLTPTDDEIEVNGKTWTSQPENMTIEFVNGVSNAVLGADPAGLELSYFRTAKDQRAFTENTANGTWTCDPFYSYPSAWNIGDDNEPYLRISMPWYTIIDTPIGGVDPPVTVYRNCYYKVILGGDQLKRNTWYDLTIDIGVLGSFDEQEEVLLPMADVTYYVADWFDGLEVESEILGGRYLVVERETYEVFNQDELKIPFTSSHNCTITDISCVRPDYTSETLDEDASYTPSSGSLSDWINVDNTTNTLVFSHKLDNDITHEDTFDYAPYTLTFTISHIDNPNYSRKITIIQYPAVYIKGYHNAGGDTSFNNKERGYVMVNSLYANRVDYTNSSNANKWQTVEGFDSSSKNPNMYIITTTVLDKSLTYILTDSRESKYYGPSEIGSGFTAVADVNGRRLQYYYPTATDNENYLSPKFRISSAYGQLGDNQLTANQAKMRCAAYQEAGFPAGRWRLPTTAELKYIGLLCANDALPMTLFGGSRYWSATNNYTFNNGVFSEANGTTAYMRCVYDDWRWGSEPTVELNAFTWGDELN